MHSIMGLIEDGGGAIHNDQLFLGGYSRGSDGIPGGIPAEVQKDKVVSGLIVDAPTECAVWLQSATVCSTDKTVGLIGDKMGVAGAPESIISEAKKKLSCDSERCVLEKSGIDPQIVRGELAVRFKIDGPLSPALLSNVNIDSIMKQYSVAFPKFFPYNFNMRDYARYSFRSGRVLHEPDTLATVQFGDLFTRGIRCCGCVINSDVYSGPGKHWMALFADARGPQWSVEFFNSSGNPPAAEWINWMEKTRGQMEAVMREQGSSVASGASSPSEPKIIKVSSMRHQDSKSECGVYSLFYIWARLNGVPYSYFSDTRVYDQHMFEFRGHLFSDPSAGSARGPFSWKEYTARYETKWEKK